MSYAREIEAALKDGFLRRTLDKFAVEYRAGRDRVFAEVDERALIQRIADVKDDAARHMEELYERFRAEAEKRGAVVHRAKDAAEAREIIAAIAKENDVHKIVKSKSMTAEEIGLNAHLEAAGIEVNETDLGEWIVQLRHERPSHMVMPAIHLSRGQVADEFEKATGRAQDHEDVHKLVKTARAELRPKFHAADMGISGANFLIAETGSLAIVTNEGNGRLVNTLPRVHVALAGLDKLVPTLDDALTALQVLPRNATGQRLTSYVTFIDGATACAKSPTGRKILHIVLLDNGRADLARDPLFSQIYRCVRCGACANVCPVFRLVGGHRMGHVYVGAIGLVLTYLYHDRAAAKKLCPNCVGCGACKDVCSGGIDLPRLIQEIRARFAKEDGEPMVSRLARYAMRKRTTFHRLLKFMRFAQKPFAGKDGFVRHLPMALFGKQGFKSLPTLAKKSFRELWPTLHHPVEKPRFRIALFAGCALDFSLPHQLVAAMKVFAHFGVEVEFPMEQTCCGLPLVSLGEKETALDVARQNVAAFAGEYDAIVTLCASCASHLKHWYAATLGAEAEAFSAKVMDFSSFVHDKLGLTEKDFSRLDWKVAYHASCHLCRELGVKEAPRALISAAAHYTPTPEEESCCGFGGSWSMKFPAISKELMHKKLDNACSGDATHLALDCPGCTIQLRGGADREKRTIQVVHVAEVLAAALPPS